MISTKSSTNGESLSQFEDTFVNGGRISAESPRNKLHTLQHPSTYKKSCSDSIRHRELKLTESMRGRKQTASSIIKRLAIDCSGRLGSFYNACHDQLVGTLNLACDSPLEEFPLKSECTLSKGDPNVHPSKLIDIDQHLHLSLLLNLTPKNGIATVIDYPQSIDQYTRILRFTYLYREEYFSDEIPRIVVEMEATHVITGISWGIDIITILQLPSNDTITAAIDLTLEKYRTYLNGERNDFKLTREDIHSMANILDTQTYSNISELDRTIGLHDLFHHILRFKIDEINHQPLTYTLRSLQSLYRPLSSTSSTTLEQYLMTLSTSMRILEICFNEDMQNLLAGNFKERLLNASKHWSVIKQEYPQVIVRYAQLVSNTRSGQVRTSVLEKILRSKTEIDLKNRINYLTRDVADLNAKGHLISELNHQQIHYLDVSQHHLTKYDDETVLKRKLIVDENVDRVLCSSDLFNRTDPALFRQFRHTLLDELANDGELRLIYADFSYCDYRLSRMMLLPVIRKDQNRTKTNQKVPLKPPRMETLNILLLGETGVGKSTFINALINYLTFSTLDKARSHQPIFDHPDQSSTQHCQSYVYHLNEKLKLRIIDTPGSDQSEQTMEHILQYVKKLKKLNAICCLLKSNESQLNTVLRSYLIELVNLFGPNIRGNVMYCFTNGRSTSDTSDSLKKKNTFCFDRESFRFLIALQNKVPFSDPDEREYEASWKNSVTESNRLIRYVHKKLRPYTIPDESEMIKHLRIKIAHLTHPMLEAIRYILRNIVINKMVSLKQPVDLPANNDHQTYQHLPHRPILLDFLQNYQITEGPISQKQDDMIDHLSLLSHISAEFSDFLMHTAHYRNGDPFLTGLYRLIGEESELCEHQNQNYVNLYLVDGLKKLTTHYEQHIQTIKSNSKSTTLTDIDQWIRYMSSYPLVSGYVIDSARTNVEINH